MDNLNILMSLCSGTWTVDKVIAAKTFTALTPPRAISTQPWKQSCEVDTIISGLEMREPQYREEE